MATDRKAILNRFEAKRNYMEDRICSGIESGRKGVITLKLLDAAGKPAAGARVKVHQRSHDFRYGANLFMLDGFNFPDKNRTYENLFSNAFNIATLPFYWDALEPEQGKPRFERNSPPIYRRPPPDRCLEYCEAHGIEPKAHCLNYANFTPSWVCGSVIDEKRELVKHFHELAARYAGRIPGWEVTNETFWGPKALRLKFYNEPDFVEWSFKTAAQFFPANRLIINEAGCRIWDNVSYQGRRSPYYYQIERALDRGARIDAIGLQFHMFFRAADELAETATYYDPERIFDVLDLYATFGAPLQITELTIPAYSWTAEDESIQAEIIRHLYRMWFSHPAMEAIVYWNLVDGFAAFAPLGDMTAGENYYHGGLLRHDLTPKPAYHAIRELFEETWRTNLSVEADADGHADFKGFYGEYDLEIEAAGRCVATRFHFAKGLREWAVQI